MESESKRVIVFSGRKVRLGLPDKALDFDRCWRWMNDPEVTKYLMPRLPVYRWVEEQFFDSQQKNSDENKPFAIETLEGRHIGNIDLLRISWIDRTAVTGTVIGEKDCWGQGYGSEAKILLLNYAFNTLNLEKINSNAYEFNERSIRYSLHCGYHIEGRLKNQVFRGGRRWDIVQLAIFREDFPAVWARYQAGQP